MSNRIVGIILLAFLIFITMKGDLAGYLKVIGIIPGDAPAAPATISSDAPKKSLFQKITGAIKTAGQVAAVAGG